MRLLITGGTGFIGSRLALEARRRQLDVVVTGQAKTPAERERLTELETCGIHATLADLQEPESARALVAGCDLVIHLAAAQHEANVPDKYFHDVNVLGTRVLLEAARAAGVRRFVYGSTIGIYGAASGANLDETTPPRPLNIYGRTKLEAEGVVRSFAASIPVTIIRISETYGPGDFRLLKLFRGIDRGRFFIIGPGTNVRQVIHVADLVAALLLAAESPAAVGETFVIAGRELLTTRTLVDQVASVLGRPSPRLRLPMWPFLAAALVFEATLRPLGIQPPLHRRRLDFFRKSFAFSTAKAERLLGFTPSVSLATGLAETAAWYRSHGYLGSG